MLQCITVSSVLYVFVFLVTLAHLIDEKQVPERSVNALGQTIPDDALRGWRIAVSALWPIILFFWSGVALVFVGRFSFHAVQAFIRGFVAYPRWRWAKRSKLPTVRAVSR